MTTETLIWVDTETTGLDTQSDHLLEIASVLTDIDGNVLDSFERVVMPIERPVMEATIELYSSADPGTGASIVWNMHNDSGLWDEVLQSHETYESIDNDLHDWLAYSEVPLDMKGDPMCGSSVNFDLQVVSRRLPQFRSVFSHRVIDISSTKELARRRHPEVYADWQAICDAQGKKPHRAMEDILWSIEEYKFYLGRGMIG